MVTLLALFYLAQIIYRMGEAKFITIVSIFNIKDKLNLECLIIVGLAYGDNDRDGVMDNWDINTEFPKLVQVFSANETNTNYDRKALKIISIGIINDVFID